MVHEQKFKDPLGSIHQVSPNRKVLDLESEVSGSIFIGGNIFFVTGIFLLHSEASDANIGIIPVTITPNLYIHDHIHFQINPHQLKLREPHT